MALERAVSKYSSSFSGVLATPSIMPSIYPLMDVTGVFKSCEILDTRNFRLSSYFCCIYTDSLSLIRINSSVLLSSRTSPSPSSAIPWLKSPSLIWCAASFNLEIGRIMPRENRYETQKFVSKNTKVKKLIAKMPSSMKKFVLSLIGASSSKMPTSPEGSL
ncbi:hypothetical protein D3C85_1012840 [compost metagenome]